MLARGTQFQIDGIPAAAYVKNRWDAIVPEASRGKPPHER
jgi:hypothetical protein